MKREFLNISFLIFLFVLGGLLAVGGYFAFQAVMDGTSQSPSLAQSPIEVSHPHHPTAVGPLFLNILPISAETLERIEDLSESGLPYSEAQEQVIALLANEMDALSVAKYLRMRNWFDEAREFVDRALAENPNSFEALLLWCQLRPPEQDAEREAGFRKLLEMNPNSVDALVGLGTHLSFDGRLEEALIYLEKVSQFDPEFPPSTLGFTYEKLGEYDKALIALKKSYETTRSPVELAHIRAIEAGNPLWTPMSRESQAQSPKETSSGSLLQVEAKMKTPLEQDGQ